MTDIIERSPHEIVAMSPYDILVDENLHSRAKVYETTIYEYAEALSNGITLPPIDVYFDGKIYLLADGFYRLEAHLLEEFDSIPVIVSQGGRKEALIHAVGANADHGLRRTIADKKKAVTIALTDTDIQRMSDNQISKICKVSQPYVSGIREVMTYNGYKFETTRICSDGRIMDVSNIGPKKEAVTAPIESETPVVGDNNDEVTGPSDQEDPEENVDTNPGDGSSDEDTQGDGSTPPEPVLENDDQELNQNGSGDDDNNLDSGETTEPGAGEDEFETDPGPEENNDTDPEGEETQDDGDSPPETESGDDDQDLNLDESENTEDVLDTDDTTDPEHDENSDTPDTDDSVDTDDDEDDTEIALELDDNTDIDETDESTDSEIEIEDPEEDTGDDNPDTSDLDGIDPDVLKLMVVHLQDTAKQQEEELKVKDNEIVDLEQQVEKLEEENVYLKEQLQGLAAAGTEASASLDINEMNEEYSYSMA